MNSEEIESILSENDWDIECQSPFEIRHRDGAFATGLAAHMVVNSLIYENSNGFSEQDMRDCFNAGINRGVTIAAIITKHDIGEEFPTYDNYMKRYKE